MGFLIYSKPEIMKTTKEQTFMNSNSADGEKSPIKADGTIKKMFEAGAHFGYSKSRRHPSMISLIFGMKNRTEIFDLEKTKAYLEKAKVFATELGKEGKPIVLASSKHEARKAIRENALRADLPYIAGRWIGGTLTNFGQIKSRINRLFELKDKKEKGELVKYTKKERLLMDREMETLEEMFGGISTLSGLPSALLVVDPKTEKTAVSEAKSKNIPVIAVMNSDCDLSDADYPLPGNDASVRSISFFVSEIVDAYLEGKSGKTAK